MSDCEHKQLVLTSQRGTDGFPIYRCALRCGALFKVKPEEITVEFAATTPTTQGELTLQGGAKYTRKQIDAMVVAPPREEVRALEQAVLEVLECYKQHGTGLPPTFGLLNIQRAWDKVRAALAATTTSTQPCSGNPCVHNCKGGFCQCPCHW